MTDQPERDEKLDGLLWDLKQRHGDYLDAVDRFDVNSPRYIETRQRSLATTAAIHAYFAEREREVEKRVTLAFEEQWTSFGAALREKDAEIAKWKEVNACSMNREKLAYRATERALAEVDRLREMVEAYAREDDKEMEIKRLRGACSTQNDEVCQILGKALGYPWFKDDPKNFPDATKESGVCVGDHVAESLASEAAATIERLREALRMIEHNSHRGDDCGKWATCEGCIAQAALASPPQEGA